MSDATRCIGLTDNEKNLLTKIQQDLPLLADLARVDVVLFCAAQTADAADVIAVASPRYEASARTRSLFGHNVAKNEDGELFKVLASCKARLTSRRLDQDDLPVLREILPVGYAGRAIGALSCEYGATEAALLRQRNPFYRRALDQLRQNILAGHLEGSSNLGAFGEHDGPLIVDSQGRILYISAIAESLYNKIGVTGGLLHRNIRDLGTDETAVCRALETGVCAEQVSAEGQSAEGQIVLVKRAIPLVALGQQSWRDRLLRRPGEISGVILAIHDMTEARSREQEHHIKSTMIQEVHHRVKNNLQTIAALLRLQARRTGSEQVVDILRQTTNRILSVAVVHEFLSQDEESEINVKEVCQRIVSEVTQAVLDPDKQINFLLEGSDIPLPAQQATSCALIVNELLQNAVEHGFEDRWNGNIRINLQDKGSAFTLEITDDGKGLPPGFSVARSANLGLHIVSSLVKEDLRGEFELVSGADESKGMLKGGVRAIVTVPRTQRGLKTTLAVGR